MSEVLNKGEFYRTIKDMECYADVYKHATDNHLYVVELFQEGSFEVLTTVVEARRYRKELDRLFFIPLAQEIWNIHGVFEAIKRDRVAA